MLNASLIQDFFYQNSEKEINKKMMFKSYVFEYQYVLDYINRLIQIELKDFIYYGIINYDVSYLNSSDVIQFSNLEDATFKVCSVIKENDDLGFGFLEIGKMLENDGIIRKDCAYRKYGENQAKTAECLGLLHSISSTYYLSCIGYIINELDKISKEKLLRRIILRNKLIRRLIYNAYTYKSADYRSEVGFLSETTISRRKSNIKYLIGIINSECDLYLKSILAYINF